MAVTVGDIHYFGSTSVFQPVLNAVNQVQRRTIISAKGRGMILSWANQAFRKRDALRVGGWDETALGEDWTMVERLRELGKVKIVDPKNALILSSARRFEHLDLKDAVKEVAGSSEHPAYLDSHGKLMNFR